jgi:hypothetical protein
MKDEYMLRPILILKRFISSISISSFTHNRNTAGSGAQNPLGATILKNAHEPLTIFTYDNSNQVVHPTVIDFYTEHSIPRWGGYRFWMVITPYPYSNDAMENPCIYASDDGINWLVPRGITNPINRANGGWKTGFNNDPDMVYDPDSNEIRVYFRFASKKELKVNMIRIASDLTISEPVTIMYQSPWTQSENTHRSLCIWRESSQRWHMWGGGGAEKAPHNIYYRFSEDGIRWGPPKICLNEKGNDPFHEIGYSNWHFSCKPNHKKKRVEFLCYAFPIPPNDKAGIFYAECEMSTPFLIKMPITEPILLPSKSGWDSGQLYRPAFCIDCNDITYYRIWYSAESKKGVWKLGYTGGYIPLGIDKDI